MHRPRQLNAINLCQRDSLKKLLDRSQYGRSGEVNGARARLRWPFAHQKDQDRRHGEARQAEIGFIARGGVIGAEEGVGEDFILPAESDSTQDYLHRAEDEVESLRGCHIDSISDGS